MATDLDRILTDAAAGPGDPLDADALWRAGRRRRTARGAGRAAGALGVVALAGVGVTSLLATGVTLDPIGEVPQEVEVVDVADGLLPVPGDDLARDNAVDHDPDALPELALADLQAPLATLGPGCDLLRREFPEASVLGVLDPAAVATEQRELLPLCQVWAPVADGLLVAPADDFLAPLLLQADQQPPLRDLPALADRLAAGALPLGDAGAGGALLLQPHDASQRIVVFDLDSGEERTLVDVGDLAPDGTRVVAAHRSGADLVFVLAEDPGSPLIAGLGQRGTPTTVWIRRGDDEPRMVRALSDADRVADGTAAITRDLAPPRLVPGPAGPLIVTVERSIRDAETLELVVTTLDGDSRVLGRLPNVFPGGLRSDTLSGPGGPSLDVSGSQVAIGVPTPTTPGDGRVVVVDLTTGDWSRAPVDDAAFAWFLDG